MPAYCKLPFFPPSVNHAYFSKGNRKILTSKGKKFKTEVKTFLAQHCPAFLGCLKPETPYTIVFNLAFEAIHTKGKTAQSRYKKIDVTNRVKLLEDALTAAGGYDDCQHMTVVASKDTAVGEDPFVEIWVFNQLDEECPIDEWIGLQPR